ncbi:MAG: hypothetical protein AB4911_23460, partial [Oscillochloridaceae bacterium umkhey_bin13]
HDLTGCQIGNAVGIEVRYLHMRVVYQTLAPPSPSAQRLWRGYLKTIEAAENLNQNLNELNQFYQDSLTDPSLVPKFYVDFAENALIDLIASRRNRNALKQSLNERLLNDPRNLQLITDYLDNTIEQNFKNLLKANVDQVPAIIDQILRQNQPGFTDLKDYATQQSANVNALLNNDFAANEFIPRQVAGDILRSQAAPERATLEQAAAVNDGFGSAYELRRAAAYTRADGTPVTPITRYQPSVPVTYEPVIGFDSAGRPLFGPTRTGTFRGAFELSGTRNTWVLVWYNQPGPYDERYYNQLAQAHAAITQHRINVRVEYPFPSLPPSLNSFRGSVTQRGNLRDWYTP